MFCKLLVLSALAWMGASGYNHFRLEMERQYQILSRTSRDEDLWIEQRLDNFRPTDERKWMQRYFYTDSFSQPTGPVFLQIGGEGPANPIWMREGHWIEMAKKFNAACFMLEHRFYGRSHPTKDVSTDNLVYLSSEQALADLANFIVNATSTYKLTGRKWIVFGGSYSGALAIWFRMKYPHLASGAVSSSAPLDALVNFKGYLDVVTHSLAMFGSQSCIDNVAAASSAVATQLKSSEGRKMLKTLFQLCDPLDEKDDRDAMNLQETLAGNIMGVAQYNRDNREFEGAAGTDITVERVCDIMDDSTIGDALHRYAQINKVIMNAYQQPCLDANYTSLLVQMRNTSWTSAVGGRQWVYQTCSEFGWYQSSDSPNQPFVGFPLKFVIDQCTSVYGLSSAEVSAGVQRSNEKYGALQVAQVVTNVTLYNGGVDPWSNVSFYDDSGRWMHDQMLKQQSGITSVFVPDTAHCAIMYPSSPDDPPTLVQARKEVETVVGEWLRP